MINPMFDFATGDQLSQRSRITWRLLQGALWLVGMSILLCLLFVPALGVHLMWNILIPIAPFLFVVAVGVWRNICPLATTSLLPRTFRFSQKKKLSAGQQSRLQLAGILALYLLVPLRHAIFNKNGPATAFLLIGISVLAFVMGWMYEWKSGWCASLCPVHPVERLYSSKVLLSLPNAHCTQCEKCVVPCPDSTPGIHPGSVKKNICHQASSLLMIGGFPGFVWGWFHVSDHNGLTHWSQLIDMYTYPLAGALVTLCAYCLLTRGLKTKQERTVISVFAAAAVACYYWYRIPALFGFGLYPGDGMLVDLHGVLPVWSLPLITILTTLFFFWWIVLRPQQKISWVLRPQYASKKLTIDN